MSLVVMAMSFIAKMTKKITNTYEYFINNLSMTYKWFINDLLIIYQMIFWESNELPITFLSITNQRPGNDLSITNQWLSMNFQWPINEYKYCAYICIRCWWCGILWWQFRTTFFNPIPNGSITYLMDFCQFRRRYQVFCTLLNNRIAFFQTYFLEFFWKVLSIIFDPATNNTSSYIMCFCQRFGRDQLICTVRNYSFTLNITEGMLHVVCRRHNIIFRQNIWRNFILK